MTKTYHIAYYGYSGIDGCQSVCQLEIWQQRNRIPVVLVTERLDNEGTSITNWAEHLAAQVCRDYEIDPAQSVWLECYERDGDDEVVRELSPRTMRSDFDIVRFKRGPAEQLHSPRWRPFGLDRAEQLVGEAL